MMMNDADSSNTFEDGFIRLLNADSETLGHLGTKQVPTDLVNPDGSINRNNRLGEIEMYRSYLGFKTGALKPGDIIETFGKGSFFGGDPEFVDQEGIQSDGVEFNIVGHDSSLAQPTYFSSINGFWNQVYKNHYVKFVAKKTGTSQVQDQSGTTITVEDVTGFTAKTLPGNVGDLLVLTGVPTSESFSLRFRSDSAVLASSASALRTYPPDSQISAVSGEQTASTLTLDGGGQSRAGRRSERLPRLTPSPIARFPADRPRRTLTPIPISTPKARARTRSAMNGRGCGSIFRACLAGATITSAKLNLFCWKAPGRFRSRPRSPAARTIPGSRPRSPGTISPHLASALDTQTLASGVDQRVG